MGILDDYKPDARVVKAVPKLSDYRERFKQRKIMRSEVISKPKLKGRLKQDHSTDKFRDEDGSLLFFGTGVEEEM